MTENARVSSKLLTHLSYENELEPAPLWTVLETYNYVLLEYNLCGGLRKWETAKRHQHLESMEKFR